MDFTIREEIRRDGGLSFQLSEVEKSGGNLAAWLAAEKIWNRAVEIVAPAIPEEFREGDLADYLEAERQNTSAWLAAESDYCAPGQPGYQRHFAG